VPVAEFEEKEYEVAADIELARNPDKFGPRLFSSGQVLEKILGYDAAADPWSGHRVWIVLGIPRPKGIRLIPSFWHPGEEPHMEKLPRQPISLILQYKRPSYLRSASAKQWHLWKRPYYRFERNMEQHKVLRRLEGSINDDVIVRYASPAFWQRCDLERNQFRQAVLESSGMVAPSILGSHRVWTYERPGSIGYPNPSGRGRIFETLDTLFASQLNRNRGQQLVPTSGFDEHLDNLAARALSKEPGLTRSIAIWIEALQAAALGLSNETTRRLTNFVAVQSLVLRTGASWHIGDPGATRDD
jgi:hypothetical protein